MKYPLLFFVTIFLIQSLASAQEQGRPNVLFIICDDLNDSLEGMGGHPQGKDIGFEAALLDWVRNHRKCWRMWQQGTSSD